MGELVSGVNGIRSRVNWVVVVVLLQRMVEVLRVMKFLVEVRVVMVGAVVVVSSGGGGGDGSGGDGGG